MEQVLRDRHGKLLGKIKEVNADVIEIRDAQGRLRGKFNKKTNETRDSTGRLVGHGNLLTSLL